LAFGIRPWSASAATTDVPDYLGRSSYMTLSTPKFASVRDGNGSELTLQAVNDLDSALAGSEDAFSLMFSASSPFDAGIRSFSHPDLGTFDFFISPVERGGGYEVVVNRSVAAPKHVPKLKHTAEPAPAQEPKPAHTTPGRKPHVRRFSTRRFAHGIACDITLEPGTSLKSATVWLTRGGVPVTSATVRNPHGNRVAVHMKTSHRPRGGHYEVTVATKDRHGHTEYKRAKLALQ
jgi:hypothetical protein